MQASEYLKPCPYCGGEATIVDKGVSVRFRWVVRCASCGIGTLPTNLINVAAILWNARVEKKKK